jgi:hypothetical protein
MALASSSLVNVGYIEEVTFGTTPVAGNYKYLRVTGESMDYTINKEVSNEINSRRTNTSMVPVSAATSGNLEAEISYNEYDPLIEGTLQSTFTAYGTAGVGTAFSATFTATTITAAVAPTGGSAFTTLQRGQWFRVNAPTGLNDGKILRVSGSVDPTSTVITLDANTPALVEGPIASSTISTSRLSHGTTQKSYSIERQSPDITEYWIYKGMVPSSMDLSISSGSLSSLSFGFMGTQAARGTVTNLPGTPVASKTYDIHSGVSGSVCVIRVNGAALSGTFVKDLSLTYDNSLRAQDAICSLASIGIGSGTLAISGSMTVYFANGSLFDSFAANNNVSIEFSTFDGAGNGYVISIPKANLEKVATVAGSKDQDMMLSVDFRALEDNGNAVSALRKAIFIDRMGAAVT